MRGAACTKFTKSSNQIQVRAKIGRIYEKIDGFVAAGVVDPDQLKARDLKETNFRST